MFNDLLDIYTAILGESW